MNVQITLKTDVFDIDYRIKELKEIRKWLNELVNWDYNMYNIKFHSSGEKLIVWFEHDEHATLFTLRWT